jgi:hypothetical protein
MSSTPSPHTTETINKSTDYPYITHNAPENTPNTKDVCYAHNDCSQCVNGWLIVKFKSKFFFFSRVNDYETVNEFAESFKDEVEAAEFFGSGDEVTEDSGGGDETARYNEEMAERCREEDEGVEVEDEKSYREHLQEADELECMDTPTSYDDE